MTLHSLRRTKFAPALLQLPNQLCLSPAAEENPSSGTLKSHFQSQGAFVNTGLWLFPYPILQPHPWKHKSISFPAPSPLSQVYTDTSHTCSTL